MNCVSDLKLLNYKVDNQCCGKHHHEDRKGQCKLFTVSLGGYLSLFVKLRMIECNETKYIVMDTIIATTAKIFTC